MNEFQKVNTYVELARPANALGVLLGFAAGYIWPGGHWRTSDFLCAILILALLHSAATIQNDIEDIGIDRSNRRANGLLSGIIGKAGAVKTVYWLFIISLLVTLLFGRHNLNIAFVLIFGGLSLLYNRPPFRFSRRPILSIIIMGLCYGALPLVYGLALSGAEFNLKSILLTAAWFIARVSTSIMKDYKDAAGDKKHGKQTFYIRYGSARTAALSIGLSAAAYLIVIALTVFSLDNNWRFGFGILLLALAARNVLLRAKLSGATESQSAGIFIKSFAFHNQFDAAVVLCLIAL